MTDDIVDDAAILTGSTPEAGFLMNKRAAYEHGAVMVCSQKRACIVVSLGFIGIIAIALIVAFTKPGCPEAIYVGEPIPGFGESHGKGNQKPALISTSGDRFPWASIRLPSFIQPLHYTLHLHPNITERRLRGNVTIVLTAIEETQFIVIHGRDLNISRYSLRDKHQESIDVSKFLEYPHHQQLYFGLDEILHRGSNYSLILFFETVLDEGVDGFYISSYEDPDGNDRYVASTHFEPTSARAAFPCFDEPQMKAKFKFSIIREYQQYSLFNMPLLTATNITEDIVRDEFEESVEMSTYLLAFIICDFSRVQNITKNGALVSVYAPAHMISQANYALRVSILITEYYEQFFLVPYPLPKQDLVALPNFAAGAMENWGLITYRETSLMFDPIHTSSKDQQGVTVVIAHELAHQWFGNLVTMSWWQDLWLNEGFASFMEALGTDIAEPGWGMEEQFIIDQVQPALSLDSLLASHPISTPVQDPADIESLFDAISYKKGASIIKMLEVCVGRNLLQKGLRTYLNEHRYSSADTNDLWMALTKAAKTNGSPLNVKEIMDSWTLQAGFPLVSVNITEDIVNISQSRFVECQDNASDPNVPLNPTLGYMWHIPITYLSSDNPKEPKLIWLNGSEDSFEVPSDITWLKINVGQRGFYRVNYDTIGWEMLSELLLNDPMQLSPADRASLIDDAFSLVRSGSINCQLALDLTSYLRNETSYAPWHTALKHLFQWSVLLFNHPSYTTMMAYMQALIEPHYQKLGWNDTGSHLEKLLRSKILSAALDVGDSHAVKSATKLFQDWKNQQTFIPPNLRRVAYSAGVRYGTEEDWRLCWSVYNSSDVPSERKLMLQALAQTRDPWMMHQYLDWTLDPRKIRSQDVLTVLSEVSLNPGGHLAAWRHIRHHWDTIIRRFGKGSFTIGAIIKAVTQPFSTEFDLREVEQFFKGKDIGPAKRSLDQSLETIRLHIQWQRDNQIDIGDWLHNFFLKES